VDFPDTDGETPLHICARHGYVAMAKRLLDHGANIEARDNKDATPLWLAAELGQVEFVNLLASRGANLDSQDEEIGFAAIHRAATKGQVEVIKALIKLGANMNVRTYSVDFMPIYYAVLANSEESLKVFLDHGCYDEDMLVSCLYCACNEGHNSIARLLVQAGADTSGYESSVRLLMEDMEEEERDDFFKDTRSIKRVSCCTYVQV
ncbi:ankyrin, partial [Mytilinidion resinicola]